MQCLLSRKPRGRAARSPWRTWVHIALCVGFALRVGAAALRPVVEVEEDVYRYQPANNGAGPLWCSGSACLVRVGANALASGLETLPAAKPLNNCRWLLFHRATEGWRLAQADPKGRTREPCPLAVFSDGRLFLSANPTLVADPEAYSGPARPELLQFDAAHPARPFRRLIPKWQGNPRFTEHSYRSLAADGADRELILFQNIGYTHAEWTFMDRAGRWAAQGRLKWPWGAEYAKPQPVRVCYPDVALRRRAVYFCGVSDIVEPNPRWRAYKRKLTGREWDYDFRRLFYTWTPDITKEPFRPWLELDSREATCGWITPGDLWVGPDGTVHVVWTVRALDERLRPVFFPDAEQFYAVKYARIRNGRLLGAARLFYARPPGPAPGRARFQPTPEGRLFVVFYLSGRDAGGRRVSEDRLLELKDGRLAGPGAALPLRRPMRDFFTATPRAGSPPSRCLEMLGECAGAGGVISYARIRLE